MMAPEISVIIPTRDRWPLLSRALGGALHQEDVDLEVIVVDDGSTDDTPERLAAMQDDRLRVFRHEQSLGVARSRNDGVAEARGAWVAFLDDDDAWSPRKLRAQLDAVRSPRVAVVWTGVVVVDERGEVLRVDAASDPDDFEQRILTRNLLGGPSSVIARTEIVRRVGGFDPELSVLADWDLWIRLAAEGTGAASPDLLTGYLVHSRGMTVVDVDRTSAELTRMTAKYSERGFADSVDHAWFSNWLNDARALGGRPRTAALRHLRSALTNRSSASFRRAARLLLGDHAVAALEPIRSRLAPRQALPRPPWLELYAWDEASQRGDRDRA